MVGAIDDLGLFPGSILLAIRLLFLYVLKEKSVSSLFNKNPPFVINLEPNPFSIVVVIENAFPYISTIEICEVDGNSIEILSVKL